MYGYTPALHVDAVKDSTTNPEKINGFGRRGPAASVSASPKLLAQVRHHQTTAQPMRQPPCLTGLRNNITSSDTK